MKVVSNTEITTANSCGLQHYYMYGLGLGPRNVSMPLYRGSVGHSALEAYYKCLMDGNSAADATSESKKVLLQETSRLAIEEPWADDKLTEVCQLQDRLKHYSTVYPVEPFRVLAVEKTFTAEFTPSIQFGLILDLLVEMTTGRRKGELGIIDHKFAFNWKTTDELLLDAQLPKYKIALQKNGYPVKWVMFNQIRTRKMNYSIPQEMFRRSYHAASDEAGEIIWQEQMDTAVDITAGRIPVRRALAPMVCKYCLFKDPCTASMNGENIDRILSTEYMIRERPLKELFND